VLAGVVRGLGRTVWEVRAGAITGVACIGAFALGVWRGHNSQTLAAAKIAITPAPGQIGHADAAGDSMRSRTD
jgi:hypothetical protein